MHIGAVDQANLWLTRTGWIAERPASPRPRGISGRPRGLDGVLRDWYDLNNYGRNDANAGNIVLMRQRGATEQYVAQLNVRYSLKWERPSFLKFGAYEQVTVRQRENISNFTANYVGPNNNQLNAPLPVSRADFRIAQAWGSDIGILPVPDKVVLRGYLEANPSWFTTPEAQRAASLDGVLGSPQRNPIPQP